MHHRFQCESLVPYGFSVNSIQIAGGSVQIQLRPRSRSGVCPDCGQPSRRIQSRYIRRVADLPLGGRCVQLVIKVRRFWCGKVLCGRRIVCERFDDRALARYSRRTQRLETIVHHLG
ncbi:transposase family protein [Cohaesibacter sp. ES.047]|uniref:transposase family protein n=1 Tax=Cohaesibacter sp. ES.047 TaxID=1798205 RepID=UPI000BB80CF5|nr:transposase family protein [Cohaesibacter sp. ES.047]